MRPTPCRIGVKPGFLLLEVLVGMTVFALFVGAVGYTLLYGQESTIMAGQRMRAVKNTDKALEATRSIRDVAYTGATVGPHGVWVHKTTKKWAFTGAQIVSTGSFITKVTVSTIASDWLRLTAQTKWKRGYARSGSVIITSELTDWRTPKAIGNWSSISLEGSVSPGGSPQFNNLVGYSGSTIFASVPSSPGLYVFDVRTLTAPTRINNAFSLGVGAYDVAILGSVLYVATADSSQEIRAYNIGVPGTFTAANLIGTYNLPGSARARSLAVAGDMLYVGATASATSGQDEFYAFQVTSAGGITLKDTINDNSSTFNMIALSGTSAYVASTMDTSELRVIDVESGSNILSLGGYNLSDRTLDGMSVAVSGTSALIGTLKGSSIQEAVLFDLQNAYVPTATPWYHEGSGSVLGIDMDPSICYGFIAAQSNRKAFQVFNVRNTATLAELTTYTSTTGVGRGLMYDAYRDRVYMITDNALLIFKPGVATGACP